MQSTAVLNFATAILYLLSLSTVVIRGQWTLTPFTLYKPIVLVLANPRPWAISMGPRYFRRVTGYTLDNNRIQLKVIKFHSLLIHIVSVPRWRPGGQCTYWNKSTGLNVTDLTDSSSLVLNWILLSNFVEFGVLNLKKSGFSICIIISNHHFKLQNGEHCFFGTSHKFAMRVQSRLFSSTPSITFEEDEPL